ncbi:hypothetical protein [Clostridium sp.]|uniref:LexA family protein n=1 Tax=Clostridium sp. TaxID=1506 RepID=UPI002FC97D48
MGSKGDTKRRACKPEGIHRRRNIMKAINDYIDRKGYPPSLSEIGESVNLSSKSSIHAHMQRLIEKGYISMEKGIPRSIKVLKDFD